MFTRRAFVAQLTAGLTGLTAALKLTKPAAPLAHDADTIWRESWGRTWWGQTGLAGESLMAGDIVTYGPDGKLYRASFNGGMVDIIGTVERVDPPYVRFRSGA